VQALYTLGSGDMLETWSTNILILRYFYRRTQPHIVFGLEQ